MGRGGSSGSSGSQAMGASELLSPLCALRYRIGYLWTWMGREGVMGLLFRALMSEEVIATPP